MATTHQFVSLKNSCIKQPVNPDTGLPTTREERNSMSQVDFLPDSSRDYRMQEESGLSKSVNFDTTSHTLPGDEDLSHLSDEAFYAKIVKLKQEHKKTLDLCEQIYSEKMFEKRDSCKSPIATVTVARDFSMTPTKSSKEMPMRHEDLNRSYGRDRIKDMSRPPSGRPKTADPLTRKSVENKSEQLNDSAISGRSTISGMWENFSIDEYVIPARKIATRPRSASLSRIGSKTDKDAANQMKKEQSQWNQKITIPKPFSMTIRESYNTGPKKLSRAWQELEKEREKRAEEEERELHKQFKATPVPAHIYMPIYDELTHETELRRKSNKEKSQQLLKSQERPFKFAKRDHDKHIFDKLKQRRFEETEAQIARTKTKTKTQFKAAPFPEKLFNGTATELLEEADEYRRIRIEMRAKHLLKSSSLPPNMASRGKDYADSKSRQKMHAEKARAAGYTEQQHTFQPNTNRDMPNFDGIHRTFMKKVASRKMTRENTVCKPFNLRTRHIDSKEKIYEDIARDEEVLTENRWPFQNPRAKPQRSITSMKTLSTSMDALPTQMTTAAQMRSNANRGKLEKKVQTELDELEAMRKRRIREQMMKQTIKEKVLMSDQSLSLERQRKQKLREFRESELARQEEYKATLAEMKERVDKQPLLFERTAQENARRKATKRYQDTIAAAGIDQEFIERKYESSSASMRSRGADDTDDDTSPHRSSRHTSARSSPTMTASKRYTDTFEHEQSEHDEPELEAD